MYSSNKDSFEPTALSSKEPVQSQIEKPFLAKVPLQQNGLKSADEILLCQERLNPEEQQQSSSITEGDDLSLVVEQKPVLQICLGLPGRKNAARYSNVKLVDAQSFGGHGKAGLAFVRSQRQRVKQAEPLGAKHGINTLLHLPEHLLKTEQLGATDFKRILTRKYLTSTSFTHLFNIKPAEKSVSKIQPEQPALATKAAQPKQQHLAQSLQQQTQQIAQRRHLLSKRTRVSAQQADDHQNMNCLDGDCIGSPIPLKRFKTTSDPSTHTKMMKCAKQASVASLATQASLPPNDTTLQDTFKMVQNSASGDPEQLFSAQKITQTRQRSLTDTEAVGLGEKQQIVIENDSKEVLLRMFERLISKEQAAGAGSGGAGHKREMKRWQKQQKHELQKLEHHNRQAVKDTGISTGCTLSLTRENPEEQEAASDLKYCKDGVYRIQFQSDELQPQQPAAASLQATQAPESSPVSQTQ